MSQTSSQGAGNSGLCSVCLSSFQLFGNPPQVRKHGHTKSRGPCLGSYHPPFSGAPNVTNLAGTSILPPQLPGPDVSQGGSFTLIGACGQVLPRIPKGARGVAAQELANRLEAVIKSPNDVSVWTLLFGFSTSFLQPARGGSGRGKNLTTAILKQIRAYASSASPGGLHSASSAPPGRTSNLSEEEQRARRASFKLQEGDVRGAARVLSSTESLAPRNVATVDILNEIHPS